MHAWAVAETQAVAHQLVWDGDASIEVLLAGCSSLFAYVWHLGCALVFTSRWANLQLPCWLTLIVQSALMACILAQCMFN